MVQGKSIVVADWAAEVRVSDGVMSAWAAVANDFVVGALEVEASDFLTENASEVPGNEIPHDSQQIGGEAAEAVVGSPRVLALAMETVHEMQHGRVHSLHVR